MNDGDKWKILNERSEDLQKKVTGCESKLSKLNDRLKENERKTASLSDVNLKQSREIDSLRSVCRALETTQSADRKSINHKVDTTNSNVQNNQNALRSRTLWGGTLAFVLLVSR